MKDQSIGTKDASEIENLLKKSRNSSASSKDSGNCVDSNTTNSSKSASSQSKKTSFPTNLNTAESKSSESSVESVKKTSSQYSIDRELYYVDKKLRDITTDGE